MVLTSLLQKCLSFFTLLVLVFTSESMAGVVTLDDTLSYYPLGSSLEILEDKKGTLTLNDIVRSRHSNLFVPFNGEFPSFGIVDSVYWYRFSIDNRTAVSQAMLLAIECSWLDSIRLYTPASDGKFVERVMGNAIPFQYREYEHHQFLSNLKSPPGVTTYFLRIQTRDPFMTPITLWKPEAFHYHDRMMAYYYGMFFGALILMFFYNGFIYFSLRDRPYLFYCLYLLGFFTMNFSYNGFAFQFWWPDSPRWDNWSHSTCTYLFQITGLLFAISFLNTKQTQPRFHKILVGFLFLLVATYALSALAGNYAFNVASAIYFVNLYAVLTAIAGVLAWFTGYRAARFFIVASLASLIGATLTSLTVSSVIPYRFATYHAAEYGILLDMLLLSLALADRINILRAEKEYSQQMVTKHKLQLHQALEQANEELERKVQERTTELVKAKNLAEYRARTDVLTGINNRRAFTENAEKEFARAKRYQQPLALIIFDLDKFKEVNDSYGHAAGDSTIRSAAQIALENIRETDTVGRIGGEEYAVLYFNTNKAEAKLNAERLRETMESTPVAHNDTTIYYTASFGVTELDSADEAIGTMIQRADDALYESKRAGRNCVTEG